MAITQAERSHLSYLRHKQQVNERARQRYLKLKNTKEFRDHHAAYMRAYWKTHPEQVARQKTRKKEWTRGAGRFICARLGAHKRGLDWTLTEEQFLGLVKNAVCHYCGGILPQAGAALDRKDNRFGYTLANVVPCCHDCNTMKGSFLTYEEMIWIWQRRRQISSAACLPSPAGDSFQAA